MSKGIAKKYMPMILPSIFLLFQGIYTNAQYAVSLLLLLLTVRSAKVPKKVLVSSAIMVLGFFISSLVNQQGISFIYELPKIAILLAVSAIDGSEEKEHLQKGILYACSVSSIIGIIAFVLDLRLFGLVDFVDVQRNVNGFFGYANTMAVFSAIGAIISFYYIKKDDGSHLLYDLFLLANITCLYLTHSRFAFAALLLSIITVIYISFKKSRIAIMIGTVIAMIAALLMITTGNQDVILKSTFVWRLIYWKDVVKLIIKNPLGIGIHRWMQMQTLIQTADYSVKYAHNGILQLMLDGGIVCGAGFCVFALLLLIERIKNKDVLCVALLVLILSHAFVDIDLCYGSTWLMLGFIATDSDKKVNLKKPLFIGIAVLLSLSILLMPEKNQIRDYVTECTQLLDTANYEELSKLCDEWIEFAPRRQAAYDMKYIALKQLGDEEGLEDLKEFEHKMNIVWQGEEE